MMGGRRNGRIIVVAGVLILAFAVAAGPIFGALAQTAAVAPVVVP